MILLAFLITADHRWRKAKVTLLRATNSAAELEKAHAEVATVLASSRLAADTKVIDRNGRPLADVMGEHSGGADLAILGLPSVETSSAHFYGPMEKLVAALPTAILVRGAAGFASDAVLHDETPVDSAGSQAAPGSPAADATSKTISQPNPPAPADDATSTPAPSKPVEKRGMGRRKKTQPQQIAAVVSVKDGIAPEVTTSESPDGEEEPRD